MVPLVGACTTCSIFIAFMMSSGSPSITSPPSSTLTLTIVPCWGAETLTVPSGLSATPPPPNVGASQMLSSGISGALAASSSTAKGSSSPTCTPVFTAALPPAALSTSDCPWLSRSIAAEDGALSSPPKKASSLSAMNRVYTSFAVKSSCASIDCTEARFVSTPSSWKSVSAFCILRSVIRKSGLGLEVMTFAMSGSNSVRKSSPV